MTDEWHCEAYGPDMPAEIGARCFVAPQHTRACATRDECGRTVAAQRQRMFHRMNELAAAGDQVGTYLADQVTSPDQIFNGDGAAKDQP